MTGPKGDRQHRVLVDEVGWEGQPTSDEHPYGRWQNHHGWAAPIWHDHEHTQPVHLYDLSHATVPQEVRERAVLALRRLIDPTDTGPQPKSTRGDAA